MSLLMDSLYIIKIISPVFPDRYSVPKAPGIKNRTQARYNDRTRSGNEFRCGSGTIKDFIGDPLRTNGQSDQNRISFPEILPYFFEVLADREALGAFLLAFPALLAERSEMGGAVEETAEEHRIVLLCLFLILVDVPAVEHLEALRDAHTVRAGHAVLAPGAGDQDPFLQLFF